MHTRSSITLLMAVVAVAFTISAFGEDKPKEAKEAKTCAVKVKDITLTVPETWKQTQPSSSFRAGQFSIPAAEGDKEPGELVVFTFGGGGGGVDANVKRWVDQFQSKGRKSKTTIGESTQGKYVFLDVTGTYNKPVGPPIQRKTKPMPGARMLSVILAVEKKGNYFLRVTGPEKTVAATAKSFRKSFGADAAKEKEYKSEQNR